MSDGTMQGLCRLVADVLRVEPELVNEKTGPGVLPQWDSLAHIHLVAAVEETYGVELSTDEIINLLSVMDIAALLQEKGVSVD